ncbi:hypothetical protein [Actinacidiphila yeochonensis]|uniref:hypothetical protein n=1 Tax=Actinacidiphila yeochonensis TaxID=89050 RepID=UPI00099C06A7|nr:hypothetical protein [Actinacidiphila yeochonensis]
MHSFDASSRAPYQRYIPSMRAAQEPAAGGVSSTPIYDALYSEYRRLFRTLPGDRTGEEAIQFKGFGSWHSEYPQAKPPGRHRGPEAPGHAAVPPGEGPAALPPGRGDNRML